MEKEYCAKDRLVSVFKPESVLSNNPFSSATDSGSGHSSFDPNDLSSDGEEYITPKYGAEITPGRSDCAALLLTAARLYLNSPPKSTMNWVQINPNLNDDHSDPMEIGSTFWITDWWCQQEEMHIKYTDLSNVAHDRFSIIPHRVGVEASISLGCDFIGWRQSTTTGETLCKEVIVRHLVQANNRILAGDDPALAHLNPEQDSEMKEEAEDRILYRMANVHDHLVIWQGGPYLCAPQTESRTQSMQMTAVGYISDTEDTVNTSWSLFQPDSVNAFTLSERSPLPPALSAKDLPGGRTQILNVC